MKLIISVLLIITIFGTSCSFNTLKGSKNMIEKEYELTGFENINVKSMFTVNIVQSDEFKVKLKCNENIEEYVVIEKEGNILKLSLKGNTSFINVKCIATVYMPELNEIESSGATKINLSDFTTDQLKIVMSGASDIYGNIIINDLEIKTSGASKINLTGDVANGIISISGASKMNGKDLIFDKLEVDCSGASKMIVNVKDELDVDLSGVSRFDYYGSPKVLNKDISGVGKINHLD